MIEYQIAIEFGEIFLEKVKITVIKKFNPKEVFGHEIVRQDTGNIIPTCGMVEGKEYLVEDLYQMPDDFCPRVWFDSHDLISLFFYNGDFEYPEPGITYVPCRDTVQIPPEHTEDDMKLNWEREILWQNLKGIKWADECHVIWDLSSLGTVFDMGSAYALGKPILVVKTKTHHCINLHFFFWNRILF